MYYAPAPYVAAAPVKRQKPVGIVITLLGIFGLLIAVVMIGVGVWQGTAAITSDSITPTTAQSKISGSTTTYEFEGERFDMFAVYVPEKDLAHASCTAEYSDGTSIDMTSSAEAASTTTIDGTEYARYDKNVMLPEAGDGTITCTRTSAPAAFAGPVSGSQVLGWFGGGVVGGVIVGIIAGCVALLGIFIMIVRALLR